MSRHAHTYQELLKLNMMLSTSKRICSKHRIILEHQLARNFFFCKLPSTTRAKHYGTVKGGDSSLSPGAGHHIYPECLEVQDLSLNFNFEHGEFVEGLKHLSLWQLAIAVFFR